MKSTGIIRKVDELGRIVLPIELRRTLDIAERDELEIYMESDRIILQKFEPACVFCGSSRGLILLPAEEHLSGMHQKHDGILKKTPNDFKSHSGSFNAIS